MIAHARYLRLDPDAAPAFWEPQQPFLAAVIIRAEVTPEWQWEVSKWLVSVGCLYMCAWGSGCSSWDDSVDYAHLEKFSYGDSPPEQFVMTTWHDDQSLENAIWFAKHTAEHEVVPLELALIVDISSVDNEEQMLALWDST